MNFTLFTTCRQFDEIYGYPQESALESWTHLKPRPEIVVIGDDDGTEDVARRLDLTYIPKVERSDRGTPYVKSLFSQAQNATTNELLAYCNADTLLTQSFADAFFSTAEQLPGLFLITGARWSLNKKVWPADFSGDWDARLRKFTYGDDPADPTGAACKAKPSGMDYFAYRRGVYDEPREFPPLVIGRAFWDPWLVWRALQAGADVVDGIQAILAVHQYHPHLKNAKSFGGVERERNRRFAKKQDQLAHLWDATYRLTPELELVPAPDYSEVPVRKVRDTWAEDVGWDYGK